MSKPSRKKRQKKNIAKKSHDFGDLASQPAEAFEPEAPKAALKSAPTPTVSIAQSTTALPDFRWQRQDIIVTLLISACVFAAYIAIYYINKDSHFLTDMGTWLYQIGNISI
ncbi:hypothetical protein ACFL2B_03170 [Patescibacteria group bacterium]